jgi:hypothetical protein
MCSYCLQFTPLPLPLAALISTWSGGDNRCKNDGQIAYKYSRTLSICTVYILRLQFERRIKYHASALSSISLFCKNPTFIHSFIHYKELFCSPYFLSLTISSLAPLFYIL